MSLIDKRAKLILPISQVEAMLNLPEGMRVTRLETSPDPSCLTVHIVSEDFAAVHSDMEAGILSGPKSKWVEQQRRDARANGQLE